MIKFIDPARGLEIFIADGFIAERRVATGQRRRRGSIGGVLAGLRNGHRSALECDRYGRRAGDKVAHIERRVAQIQRRMKPKTVFGGRRKFEYERRAGPHGQAYKVPVDPVERRVNDYPYQGSPDMRIRSLERRQPHINAAIWNHEAMACKAESRYDSPDKINGKAGFSGRSA